MTKKHLLKVSAIALITGIGPTIAAVAQTKAPALEEIVVTAQKRSESIQNVPITVTAVTPTAIAANKVETTADIQVLVPSLVYGALGGYAEPYLRGVGSTLLGPNFDPSIATYVDGAYVANDEGTIENLLGVERVEVLEGPQGTLYGRNAVGGAISVTTLTPTQTPQAQVTMSTGNYARKEGSAYVSGGITDKLSLGLYVAGDKQDSYIKRVGPGVAASQNPEFPDDSSTPDGESQWGARLKAVFKPTDELKLTASLEATGEDGFDGSAYREGSANALAYVFFPGASQDRQPYTENSLYGGRLSVQQRAFTLREEYDLGWANLVGVSNYRQLKQYGVSDIAGTAVPLLATAGSIKDRQYSQEIQLLSPQGSAVQWIGGIFAFHDYGTDDPNDTFSTILFGPSFDFVNNYGQVNTDSYAAFGQATFPLDNVAKGLKLTVGGRYTIDKKAFWAYDDDVTASGVLVPPATNYPSVNKTWGLFTPKIALDYKYDNTLFYVSYSKGYKSGAYNITAPTDPGPAAPEKLNAYEVGAKSRLWGGRIHWDTSAYYYDYQNLQVEIVNYSVLGNTNLLQNAAAAKAFGVESSLGVAVTQELKLHATGAWEYSTYTKYNNFAGVNPVTLAPTGINATGNQLERAPKWVGSIGAVYDKDLPFGGTVEATTDLYYNGGYFWDASNSFKQNPYTLLNASLGYTFPDDRWTVSLWGKNLTNTLYESNVLAVASFGILDSDAPPRMYGVSVTYKFR